MGVNTYNYDIASVFPGPQPFIQEKVWTNTSGSEVTVYPGRLFGQIAATGLMLPNISSATDGSEMPYGVLAGIEPITLANGATATVPIAIRGEVNQNKLTLGSGDTLATLVRTVSTGGGTLGALIIRDTQIVIVPTTNLTGYDNSTP